MSDTPLQDDFARGRRVGRREGLWFATFAFWVTYQAWNVWHPPPVHEEPLARVATAWLMLLGGLALLGLAARLIVGPRPCQRPLSPRVRRLLWLVVMMAVPCLVHDAFSLRESVRTGVVRVGAAPPWRRILGIAAATVLFSGGAVDVRARDGTAPARMRA